MGPSSKAVTTMGTPKAMPPMAGTRIIHSKMEARARPKPTITEISLSHNSPPITEARARTKPTKTKVIGMATTRPAITNLSMSASMASSSTGTIPKRVHTRGTKRMTRTIRRLRRRNLTMSPSARAGTRSSLLLTRESLSGKKSLQRKILPSSHSG